jgi:energy-coupling factor transporter ATP-binding protein EcfA2
LKEVVDMNERIANAYRNGELVLLIGAGASLTSLDQNGKNLLSSKELAQRIAEESGWNYSGEPLPSVYVAAKKVLGDKLNDLIIGFYRHCRPSHEYLTVSKYSWPRIYTLNIDDALDKALFYSPQKVNIRHRLDKVYDQDQLFKSLDYVKLNGSADRIELGFIFSQDEYGKASAKVPLWYRELAEDFYRYTFLFVGTKINEPLFYHQIARYRDDTHSVERRSYVLTPHATEIEKNSLAALNLEHIPGTMADFASWLTVRYPVPLKPIDIAFNKNPALQELFSKNSIEEKNKYATLFDDIVIVSRDYLKSQRSGFSGSSKIRPFYRGFKPEWSDILKQIPATLEATVMLYEKISELLNKSENLLVVAGPAGSGKTTLLKQVALMLSDQNKITCYFLEKPTSNFEAIIVELEKINKNRYCIFYDKLDSHAIDLRNSIKSGRLKKGLFIGSESQRKWENNSKDILGNLCSELVHLSEINKNDAANILDKLKKYGPWTRLSRMKKYERINELLVRSKRQLLIGLLETTYGEGFEKIIEKEYNDIPDGEERSFMIIVGLATMHRYYVKQEYVSRALAYLGINQRINSLALKLSGIIYYNNGKLLARHPVYVRHLFDNLIATDDIYPALKSLLMAFTVYEAPVSKHIGKNELSLFKALINHRFLNRIFRTNRQLVFEVYASFEKHFENDGHFWLQYGLALRDINKQEEAFEKFKTALLAFPSSSHIEHALAQQELIIACTCQSKVRAYDLLDTAKERLENQIKYFKDYGNYPIVTLSEGHTAVVKKFDGDSDAKKIARIYANRISKIDGYREHSRLSRAWINLTTYTTTGEWSYKDGDIGDIL